MIELTGNLLGYQYLLGKVSTRPKAVHFHALIAYQYLLGKVSTYYLIKQQIKDNVSISIR